MASALNNLQRVDMPLKQRNQTLLVIEIMHWILMISLNIKLKLTWLKTKNDKIVIMKLRILNEQFHLHLIIGCDICMFWHGIAKPIIKKYIRMVGQ